MIEYFDTHLYTFWFVIGFILLGIEILLLGFGTGFLLFIGLSALTTGGLLWFELVPLSWMGSITTFVISSVVISFLLWKPLKSLQNKDAVPEKDSSSDLIGYTFRLSQDISITEPGSTRYSGIEWRVKIDDDSKIESIAINTRVTVTAVNAGEFIVIPVDDD